jgi:hypothetical protein
LEGGNSTTRAFIIEAGTSIFIGLDFFSFKVGNIPHKHFRGLDLFNPKQGSMITPNFYFYRSFGSFYCVLMDMESIYYDRAPPISSLILPSLKLRDEYPFRELSFIDLVKVSSSLSIVSLV